MNTIKSSFKTLNEAVVALEPFIASTHYTVKLKRIAGLWVSEII